MFSARFILLTTALLCVFCFWSPELSAKHHSSRSRFSFNLHLGAPALVQAPAPIYRERIRERVIVAPSPYYYSERVYSPYYQERIVVEQPYVVERYYVYPGY